MHSWLISLSAGRYKHLVISSALGKAVYFFLQFKPQLVLQNQISLLLVNPMSFRNKKELEQVHLCFVAMIEREKRKKISKNFKVRVAGKS